MTVSSTFTPQSGAKTEALDNTVTIAKGDTVNFDFTVAGNQSARFDVDRDSAFYVWVRKTVSGRFTISNINMTLRDFVTDGAGVATATKASENNGAAHLGPTFNYSAFGIRSGEYFQFSGIDVSFVVDDLVNATSFEASQTFTLFLEASISETPTVVSAGPAVSAVPVPAALPLLLAAIGGLGFAARRRTAA